MPVMRTLGAAGFALAAGLAITTVSALAQTAAPAGQKAQAAQVAQTQSGQARTRVARQITPRSVSEQRRKEAINSNTIGLAAGRTEGAPLQFAAELARVLDDGDNMRVLPIVTRGPFDNIFDLLYLRGVDAAIVYGDILEHFKKDPEIAAISKRINFLVNLFPSELHIFARPEINSLADLAGKPVNFNSEGTAAAYSGPIIFERLGIKVEAKFDPHSKAMEEMKKGPAYAATVWVSSKPLAPFLKGNFPEGFKFLPVEYTDKLDYYLPSYLEHADYPALIPKDAKIPTLSVPALLAVYDWPADTERYRRMVKFTDHLVQRFEKLQKEPGFHPKWKDVNLAAAVPGWQRFKPLQDRLDKLQPAKAVEVVRKPPVPLDATLARQQASRAAPGNPAEQDKIFKEFLEWSQQQKKQ